MKMKIKERRKLLISNRKYIGREQSTLLQFGILSYHENRRIKSYYENSTPTRKRVNNIHVKNHESDRIKLRNYEKRNVSHHLNSQEIKKISKRNTKKD